MKSNNRSISGCGRLRLDVDTTVHLPLPPRTPSCSLHSSSLLHSHSTPLTSFAGRRRDLHYPQELHPLHPRLLQGAFGLPPRPCLVLLPPSASYPLSPSSSSSFPISSHARQVNGFSTVHIIMPDVGASALAKRDWAEADGFKVKGRGGSEGGEKG
eukprot:763335-Hanusia_phi.AAC.3